MRNMFNYSSRPSITCIRCIAHKLHPIIYNSLNLWVKQEKKQMTTDVEETGGDDTYKDDEDDTPIRLSQMIRSMLVDVNNESIDSNNEEKDNINLYAVRYSFQLI